MTATLNNKTNQSAVQTGRQLQNFDNSCRVVESKREIVHEDPERSRDKQQAACLKLNAGAYHANPSTPAQMSVNVTALHSNTC